MIRRFTLNASFFTLILLSLNAFGQSKTQKLNFFKADYGAILNKDSMDQVAATAKTIPVQPLMSCPSSNNFVTLYAQNNGQRGAMFDITAITCVQIKCFEANLDPGTTNIEIYTKTGTHVGFETNPGAWTLVGTATNVTSSGANLPTAIPIAVNVSINATATQAFYITRTTIGGPIMDYTNGSFVGNIYASDVNVQVKEGTGKDYPFGASFSPRDFNGTIYYDLGGSISPTGVMTGPITACAGSTQTYSVTPVTGATTYLWTVPTGATVTTGQGTNTVTVTFGSTSGNVCVTPSNGCVTGTQVCTAVTVNPIPVVTASASPTTYCAGGSSSLTSSGGVSFSWAPATGLSCTTCSNPTANPTATTTYTVFATAANGCSNSATATITVNSNPIATASASPTAVCLGNSSTLNASGGTSFAWSPATGLSSTTTANPTANPTTTTTYTVVVTNAAGCTASATVTLTINPLPVVSAGPDQSFCNNGTVSLSATAGGTSYSWAPATGLSCFTCQNTTASPTTTTTYVVFMTAASGCSNTDTVTVVVNIFNMTVAATNNTICTGSPTALLASSASTYSWAPATGLSCTTCQSTNATPTATTTYTVFATNANGCTANASVTITVNTVPNPVATASPSTICAGSSSAMNVTGGTFFSWTPASGLSSTTISNPTATPTATTTYTVIATDPGGCTAATTVTVTVNPVPVPTASATPSTICSGASSLFNAGGGTSYSWQPATGLSNTTTSNPTAFPTVTTTYTLIVTGSNGCTASTTLTLTVNPLPTLNITATPTSICFGGSSSLNASGTGNTYTWMPATGLSNTTSSNPTAFPIVTTTYTVITTDANGCTNTATVTLTINPLPVITASANPTTVCPGGTTSLNASGGVTYSWIPSTGLNNSTIANPTATVNSATTYTVIGTNANGCTNTATVTITMGAGPTLASGISTPATCGNNDGTATAGNATGNGPFTYTWNPGNMTGQTVTGLATGTYTVTVTDAGGCTSSSVVNVGQVPGVIASATATPSTGVIPLDVAFGNSSSGATNYSWNFGDNSTSNQTNPSHTYTAQGTYIVTLIAWNNNPGCADTIYITIVVLDEIVVVVPNVITPNGDGKNEIFNVQSKGITDITGHIFNRWGMIVADWSGGVNGGWDGKGQNGQFVSNGTYYYVLIATGADSKTYPQSGFVEVLR